MEGYPGPQGRFCVQPPWCGPCLVSQGKRYRGTPSGGCEPFPPALSATHLGRTSPTCPGAGPDTPPPLRWRRGLVPWLRCVDDPGDQVCGHHPGYRCAFLDLQPVFGVVPQHHWYPTTASRQSGVGTLHLQS